MVKRARIVLAASIPGKYNLDIAAELGLEAKSTAARMVRGGGDSLRHHLIYNRVGGHFG